MKEQVPSHVLLGVKEEVSITEALVRTPLGQACSRMDLTAIHEILETNGYEDDEGIGTEVCLYSFILLIFPRWSKVVS